MTTQRIVRVALVLAVLSSVATVSSAAPAFDNSTIAKHYNIQFSGTGSDGSAMELVGWIDVNGSGVNGNVFGGYAVITFTAGGVVGGSGSQLSTTTLSFLLVKDEVTGLYSTSLKFDNAGTFLLLSGSFVLDDTRGRSGKFAGQYRGSFAALAGEGVARGTITAP